MSAASEMGSTYPPSSDIAKASIPIYDFQQIQEGLINDSFFVVDVREKTELMNPGRIPGTKHIPLGDLKTAFEELNPEEFEVRYKFNRPEKNLNKSPIVITCRSGVRAMKAAEALIALGHPAVGVYKGSFLDWENQGGKIVFGESETEFEDVQRVLEDKSKVVIDVRGPGERTKGFIPGTYNVPLPEIWEAFQLDPESFQSKYGFYKPDSNDELIIHCRSGIRARTAADKLALLNYDNVQVYKGSFLDWESRGGEIQTEQ